jgi:hypothetical protein
MEDDPRPSAARGGQRARAEQRLHVVYVDDVGFELANGGGHLLLTRAAAQQRRRRLSSARAGGAPLEQAVGDAGALERTELELNRALLPALDAVAVVQQENARARHGTGLT